jgi:cysteine synthase A
MDIGTEHHRAWTGRAVERIAADFRRSADTHLLAVPVPGFPALDLYLKDESTHPTGSLKHRLARSLVLYGLCNGWIGPQTTLVEASSGSTAISLAYFARLLGLPFVAVLPAGTAPAKRELIRRHGGQCEEVARAEDMVPRARALAAECGGHFLDQFTHAERATDWRGNNNIAESLFDQLAL